VITKILHKPVAIAQHVLGGVARGGLHGVVAVVRRILPGDQKTRTDDASPRISTEPVHQPPSPTTPTTRATPKKSAATLNEDRAPDEPDPVVYSSGPDVMTHVSKDDLDHLRP
jgi:hypothetical protein